jgi:hypothetical protein
MNDLRKAAKRERRAPVLWWFLMIATMTGMLCILIWQHSHDFSIFLAFLLAGTWFAPIVAFLSLSAPRRAKCPAPGPGEGSYSEWIKQARLLGRLLLYYDENKELSPETHEAIRAARLDLRDTLKAHPLSDDLDRVCGRIRSGALRIAKEDFWQTTLPRVEELIHAMEEEIAACADRDEVPVIRHRALEDVAALMARHCMPRLLERERLACAVECSWLGTVAVYAIEGLSSPLQVTARLVIEWSDFSEPWHPARMLRRVLQEMGLPDHAATGPDLALAAASVSAEPLAAEPVAVERPVAAETASPAPEAAPPAAAPKRRRVRVRVRRDHRHHRRQKRGPSLLDILLSFGQWIRYSIRAWTLYR